MEDFRELWRDNPNWFSDFAYDWAPRPGLPRWWQPGVMAGLMYAGKRLRGSSSYSTRPHKIAATSTTGNMSSMSTSATGGGVYNNTMAGLTGFRNQYSSYRGRRRATVRRLARRQTRARLDGSSQSQIRSSQAVILPAGTNGPNRSNIMVMVPSLSLFYQLRSVNEPEPDVNASGQRFFNISGMQFELDLTPNWAVQTNALAAEFEVVTFRTKRILELGDVIAVPLVSTAGSDLPPPFDIESLQGGKTLVNATNGTRQFLKDFSLFTREAPTETISGASTATNTANTIYMHPELLSKFEIYQTQKVYIPVNQTAIIKCRCPGVRVSDRAIGAIPSGTWVAATSGQDQTVNTPNLPKGWPLIMVRATFHYSSSTAPVSGLTADDCINVVYTARYRVPEQYGRELDFPSQPPVQKAPVT